MAPYINNVFSKCGYTERKYIIFDQLNPKYAKYYSKNECINLFKKIGFKDIELKHHNNYSWVVTGIKRK